jgi:cyclopropane fatty-acyl-phospholipid synthase-like methyltransferase
MALGDFDTPTSWRNDLDARWPERLAMKALLVKTLTDHLTPTSRILELGIGDGELLDQVSVNFPAAKLVAVDVQSELLEHCRTRLQGRNIDFVEQDMGKPWQESIGSGFDAVYSLQSFHDVGGREALLGVYRAIAEVLVPGGLLLNADFVVPMAHDDSADPRRFAADQHVEMLLGCGFNSAVSLARHGKLGCIQAITHSFK